MTNASGTTALSFPVTVTEEMLHMGVEDFQKNLRYFILAKDLEGNTTRLDNQNLVAKRMDIALIETIDHVRTPSSPHMVSHYRVPPSAQNTIVELPEGDRLPLQFGISKMTISLMDSDQFVQPGFSARGYIFTTPSEIFDGVPDVWRAEGIIDADKKLKLDMVNFWRQQDLDTSKWFVLEVVNFARQVTVRYVWNIQALGDTFDPLVQITDSGKDYREGVPLEFTVNATDELLEAISDLRILVNVGQSGWKDLEDVVSSMNPSVDPRENWLFGVRYHVKVQVLLEDTDYAS
ncbi:MAG TPA: hypothetical protein PLF96_14175, partial [Thermotogota bacterium]|nr:hypothetical protein [Thermotogota bacterium]